jgi:signal transduction histidine kinase
VNLLGNAVKFTQPQGRVTLEAVVTGGHDPTAQLTGPGPWMQVRVRDNGIGIATEHIAAVFEPFIQAEMGHTRTQGGTGLGLTISREFARLMDGDLTVESEAGKGTTFTLWLPSSATAEVPDRVSL